MKTILILGENDVLTNELAQKAHLIIKANEGLIIKNYLGEQNYAETRTEVLSQMFIDYLNNEVGKRWNKKWQIKK